MIKKYLSFTLCCLLLVTANSSIIFAQTRTDSPESTAEKVKANVLKRGASDKKRVKVKLLNGTQLRGYISRTGDDSFDLRDSKTRQTTSVNYSDVAKVSGSWSKGTKIGMAVAVGAVAVVAVVLLRILSIYCNNEGC